MAGAKRSRTAQGVTAERVILADMGVVDDPFAIVMLAPSWRPFVSMVQHWPTSTPPWSVARAGLATRVLFHDAQLEASLGAGTRQVAVIGAGYDTRSWRFRREGVRFFELDQAATQIEKPRRVPSPVPT
jgi:O-methyltransferase involved in polyketide biosynthesis